MTYCHLITQIAPLFIYRNSKFIGIIRPILELTTQNRAGNEHNEAICRGCGRRP
jgi:hypothetical protein